MFCTACLVNCQLASRFQKFQVNDFSPLLIQISHIWVFLCFWLLCFFLLDTHFHTLLWGMSREKGSGLHTNSCISRSETEKRKTHWTWPFMVVAEENTHYWRIFFPPIEIGKWLWEICNGFTKNKATPFVFPILKVPKHCTFSSNNCLWLYLEGKLEDWLTQ
jgi:hypothetical protein